MKRFLFIILAIGFCAASLTSCKRKCDHTWERTANYDTHTAVDKCSLCDETRMYTDPEAMAGDVQLPSVPTIFPLAPPHLAVICDETAVYAWRGTSSWMTVDADGMGSGIESDSPHPLQCKDSLPILEITKKSTISLRFEAAPSKITVKRYKSSTTDYDDFDKIEVNGTSFEAKSGDYVYEIIASWNGTDYNGTVYYAFKTEK